MKDYSRRHWATALLLMTLIAVRSAVSQNAVISPDKLIQFLNESIALYHQTTIQQQIASEPQQQLLLYDNKQLASQSVQLAFDFARGQLDLMSAGPASNPAPGASGAPSQYNAMQRMLVNLEKQLRDTQAEADSDTQQLVHATGAKRTQLQSEISELQGEIALAQARRDAVRNILDFASGSANKGPSANDLRAEVDALATSVSGTSSGANASAQTHNATEPVTLSAGQSTPSGIWELTDNLLSLSSKLRTVNSMIAETNALLQTSEQLRTPFVAQMRALSIQGDQLAAQADTANPTQLAQERQQLDALAAKFKSISANVIPLSKQNVLLTLYKNNLSSWRDASPNTNMTWTSTPPPKRRFILGGMASTRRIHHPNRLLIRHDGRNNLAAVPTINSEVLVRCKDDGIGKRLCHTNQASVGKGHRNI